MLSKKLNTDLVEASKPDAAVWSSVAAQEVPLVGTPIGMQPSVYISTGLAQRKVGAVTKVTAKCVHNETELAIRLEWEDANYNVERTDTLEFPDGAAVMFPIGDDAPLMTMGSEAQPVNAWHWRADHPNVGRSNFAAGLGTTEVTDEAQIKTESSYTNKRWSVVIRRALQVPGQEGKVRQFNLGDTTKVAFAVWEGGNSERGGLKAFSPQWYEIILEK